VHLFGFILRNLKRCTVTWTSKETNCRKNIHTKMFFGTRWRKHGNILNKESYYTGRSKNLSARDDCSKIIRCTETFWSLRITCSQFSICNV